MKILFVSRHCGYLRNYDLVLRELVGRGHQVHLAVEKHESLGAEAVVEALVAECPGITCGPVPEDRVDSWAVVARLLRLGIDYLRYLDPFYDTAKLRRVRAYNRTPRWLTLLANPPVVRGKRWRRMVGHLLHQIDASAPPPEAIVDYLRAEQPDVLLITPFVELGSPQVDYLRAARLLHIPCGLPIWSWDHLTTKAQIRDHPERVFVWNETQRREAVEIHGIPAERVVVTGAQCFDQWFGRKPSRTREDFCAAAGLPSDRPFLLYVCSAVIEGSHPEHQFVQEWLRWLRASDDPLLAKAGVLLRPYPTKLDVWRDVDLSQFGPVAVWGGNPFDEQARNDYFDALYHSAAVVGLNTSVFLEAGIVGREVLAILDPRYRDSQEGSAHFNYLLQVGGGLLRVGRGADEHLAQLGQTLRREPTGAHPHQTFLESFIRPHGLERPATPELVRGIEGLALCRVDAPETGREAVWRRRFYGRFSWVASRVFSGSEAEWARKVDGIERWRRFRAEKESLTNARRAERLRLRAMRRSEKEQLREVQLRKKRQMRDARLREKERARKVDRNRKASLKRRARLKKLIKERLGLVR